MIATPDQATTQPLLKLTGISKGFPNVRALDNVTLDIYPGEVLALIGENGAGKSTLLKILSGDYQPDSGEIHYDNQRVTFNTPAEARKHNVRVIYQEPEVVTTVSVAENLFIGALPRRMGRWIDWDWLYRHADEQIASLGFQDEIAARDPADKLSAAQRQLVEILRALKAGVRVLALDEPTSSLSDKEANRLFDIVNRLRQENVAIIYVSHRLHEILMLADRVAVLRDGQLVAIRRAQETSETELMSLMVGRPLSHLFDRTSHVQPEVVLRVEGLNTETVHDVSFEVHSGEVVGFAGLVGAGRSDVAKALFGADTIHAGRIEIDGKPVSIRSPQDAMKHGIGFTPEERKTEGLFLELGVRENASISILRQISRFRFVRRAEEHRIVAQLTEQLKVRTPSLEQEIRKLSGGNQQKVVLARWLARSPKVLMLDEPTRGIDVGAKAEIYHLIDKLAAQGIGIIFISSELPEVLGISDRIIVMKGGRITGQLLASEATQQSVLSLAMTFQAR
ncbi:MAG: sugar ABC transporter ATP-binding protein [Anaerolineae bacterium]|nr:sugar ABC transporter ATP-binding protein [Anaerolineae bacterium]